MIESEERMRMHQENRDLLIEIKTIVSKNEERFVDHMKDDAVIQADLTKSLVAVHRRVDGLFLSGVLALVLMVAGFITTIFIKRGG